MTTSTNPEAAPAAPAPPPATKPHLGTLLVVLTGTFMAGLDFFIVNVAVPSTQRDLNATSAEIQWVIAGYALAFGAGMITGGRLGDIFGRRRMFAFAMALFTLSSAACGLAPNAEFLVVARVVQGLSAALMGPQVLTILATTYVGEARARAFNAYGMAMGISAVFGQLIGGVLIQGNVLYLGWRGCFLINLPIGLIALFLVPKLVPESRAPGRPKLDLVGTLLVTLGLVAVVLPLIEGRAQGWPAWTWISLAAAVPLFALFAFFERRLAAQGGSPLIDLSMFKERAFTAGLLAQLVFWIGQASFFLVFALYVQEGRGLDALQAGLIFIPLGFGYMATSTTARWFAMRLGRQVIALGGALRLVGLTALLLLVAHFGVGGHIAWLIPALAIDGAGMGLAVAPLASTVLTRIPPKHAGSATGVLTTGVQVGNALGVSIIGVIFYRIVSDTHGLIGYAHALNWSIAFLLGVALVLIALVQLLPKVPGAK
ncbi:MFS transporter [Streptomyces polygonati]|uniref:MFS transporter n=1 Tax=Streptomyces polygonati TaxID=1617087 RepID=A0ABV8HN53_9ACTN